MQTPQPSPDQIEVVIYRAQCCAGFGAAWAAWKVLSNSARYWSARPNTRAPLEWSHGKTVALLDFCYGAEEMKRLVGVAKHVVVIDHHQSTERLLDDPAMAGRVTRFFDAEVSGAVLAWTYFHPGARVPRFLEYIEDRDLWSWKLPDSREFSESLAIEPLEFHAYNRFYAGDDLEAEQKIISETIERGRVILEYIKFNTSRLAHRALIVNWCGYWVKILNSATWMSELGHVLCVSPPTEHGQPTDPPIDFALVWNYDHRRESINCSLRTDSSGLDLSLIAQHYGGGGHPSAAGFAFPGSIKKLLKTSFLPSYTIHRGGGMGRSLHQHPRVQRSHSGGGAAGGSGSGGSGGSSSSSSPHSHHSGYSGSAGVSHPAPFP